MKKENRNNKLVDYINRISIIAKQNRRINTLEAELEELKEMIKSNLYREFIKKLSAPKEIEILKEENKNLKKRISELRATIRNMK